MIKSILTSQKPLVIKHILSSSISEIESQKGVDEVIALIDDNVSTREKVRILIDVSNYSFETLNARRIWSLKFKMNQKIQEKTSFVAIVGSTLEHFGTERKWLETTLIKFFKSEEEAEKWLLQVE